MHWAKKFILYHGKRHPKDMGASDLGKNEWERKLIRELRSHHYRWHAEQAYRGWSGRLRSGWRAAAVWLSP